MVGDKIRDLRKKLGLTQEQLAGHELTKSYVSQVELGRIRPSRKALKIMADRLGKPLGYFLDNDDDLRTVDVLLKASEALWSSGRLEEAAVGLREARLLAERMGRDDILAKIQATSGQLELSRGHYAAAEQLLKDALGALHVSESPVQVVETASALGRATSHAGRFHDAVAYFHQSVDVARTLTDHQQVAAMALETFGDFCAGLEQWVSAKDLYDEARRLAGTDPKRAVELDLRRIRAGIALGHLEEAGILMTNTQPRLGGLPHSGLRARLSLDAAESCLKLKRWEDADGLVQESLSYFQDHPADPSDVALALQLGLQSARQAHNPVWGRRYQELALAAPDSALLNPVKADAYRLRATYAATAHDALHDLAAAVQHDPDNAALALEYQVMAAKSGQPGALEDLWNLVRSDKIQVPLS